MTTAGRDETSPGADVAPPLPLVLYQLTTGTWVSQAISVAARFGVADALAGGARSADEIATVVGAHGPALYRLLRALGDVGIVAELDDHRFALTPLGDLLRTDADGSLRAWATMVGMPFHRDAWTDLYESVRTGEPAFQRVHGAHLFDHLATHPDDAAIFDAAMRGISAGFLAAIVAAYDFGRFHSIVDLGGGTGTLLSAVLRANPQARGVLVERPAALDRAPEVLDAHGVRDRCELVAGDFLAAVPHGADLYILSNILHDWDDHTAAHILGNCRRAMPPDARLLIVELVLPDGPGPSWGKLLDLEMLALTPGGRQRTASEYAALLASAGLRQVKVVPATPGNPASYVEAAPTL